MPDPGKKDDGTPLTEPTPAPDNKVDLEFAEKLVGQFKDAAKEIAEAAKSNAPATPTGPDPAAQQEKWNKALADYETLSTDGKHAEALQLVIKTMNEQQASVPQTDPTEDVGYKALVENTRARIESESKDLFTAYGAEIDAEIAKLAPEKRIMADGIREAVGTVRSRHSQELIEAQVKAKVEEERTKGPLVPPQNVPQPHLGELDDTDLHNLDLEQRQTAKNLGVSYAEFADQVGAEKSRANKDGTVDILPRFDSNNPPKPGQF